MDPIDNTTNLNPKSTPFIVLGIVILLLIAFGLSYYAKQTSNPSVGSLLKACPEEWIVDAMPGIGYNPNDPSKEYFIYQDVRRELAEFDVDWVKANCNIEPLYAY